MRTLVTSTGFFKNIEQDCEIPVSEARQRSINFKVANPESAKVKAKIPSGREIHSSPLSRTGEKAPSIRGGVGAA